MLHKFDPFKDFNRYFNHFGHHLTDKAEFVPSVNIIAENDSALLEIELPGLKKEEIDITVDNGTLTISGEKKSRAGDENINFLRVERRYGTFSRSFTIPDSYDVKEIKASFTDGVLKLVIPRKPDATPKKLSVSIN